MNYIKAFTIILILSTIFFSCNKSKYTLDDYNISSYTPQYAKGFEILKSTTGNSHIIKIKNPWQGADNIESSIFISSDETPTPTGFEGQVLEKNPTKIICMSTSHIAMLDALGVVDRVVGVSGKDYISNPYIVSNKDKIADIGFDGNINYELLISLRPDLVLLFGVNGASSMEAKLKELNIPFIYIGEYLEESPLGKSEWIVPIAELVGLQDKGLDIFTDIPLKYNALKSKMDTIINRPQVMLNVPYGDSWFMPSTSSYAAQLIEDAGGEYIYKKNTSNESKQIDIEEAFVLTSQSDFWLNVGMIESLQELTNSYPKFSTVASVKNKQVYNNTKRSNAVGGNDYWESGVVHPEIILSDLIQIFHPDTETELYYYKKLD